MGWLMPVNLGYLAGMPVKPGETGMIPEKTNKQVRFGAAI